MCGNQRLSVTDSGEGDEHEPGTSEWLSALLSKSAQIVSSSDDANRIRQV